MKLTCELWDPSPLGRQTPETQLGGLARATPQVVDSHTFAKGHFHDGKTLLVICEMGFFRIHQRI